jgi:hypothetical protein
MLTPRVFLQHVALCALLTSCSLAVKLNVELNARWTSCTLSPLQEARYAPRLVPFSNFTLSASRYLIKWSILSTYASIIAAGLPFCSEFMAQDSNTMFWKFFDDVHASLSFHQGLATARDVENDASEWAAEVVEQLVSPDVFKVRSLLVPRVLSLSPSCSQRHPCAAVQNYG